MAAPNFLAALLRRALHLQGQVDTLQAMAGRLDSSPEAAQLQQIIAEQGITLAGEVSWLRARRDTTVAPEALPGLRKIERKFVELGNAQDALRADLGRLLSLTGKVPPVVLSGPAGS